MPRRALLSIPVSLDRSSSEKAMQFLTAKAISAAFSLRTREPFLSHRRKAREPLLAFTAQTFCNPGGGILSIYNIRSAKAPPFTDFQRS